MSKSNDTSRDELTIDELDAVVGGLATHTMGPINYQKKNVTTYGAQPGGLN
jgi:hypothetical protein